MTILGRLISAIIGHHDQVMDSHTHTTEVDSSTNTEESKVVKFEIAPYLDNIVSERKVNLDWRHSIVDLMKVVDIDPSLENRRDMALELGYEGDFKNTSDMNIWLHQRVLKELEKNGGELPSELKDW